MNIIDILLFPLKGLAWVAALPLRVVAWVAEKKKVYDPEKDPCPCCGYAGEKSSNFRSCIVSCEFVVNGASRKAKIRHTCLRCGAPYHTEPVLSSEKWVK